MHRLVVYIWTSKVVTRSWVVCRWANYVVVVAAAVVVVGLTFKSSPDYTFSRPMKVP